MSDVKIIILLLGPFYFFENNLIMKNISFPFILMMGLFLAFSSCKKQTNIVNENVVDNYIYDVNGEVVYQSNAEKNRQKTPELYISTLYANLFQTSIPSDELANLSQVRLATGDKQMADELTLNSYINGGDAIVPSNSEMRADIDKFIEETYIRFFLRKPNPYEIFELKNEIEEDQGLTPELIYQGFALSNEYKFY